MKPGALLLLAFLLTACEGGGGDGYDGGDYGPSGGSGSTARFEDLFHESCELYRRCCSDEGLSIEPLADCEMTRLEDPEVGGILRRGNVRLIEPSYSQCLSWLRSGVCLEELSSMPQPCLAAFQGMLPEGGECLQAIECARAGQPVACVREPGVEDDQPGTCRTLSPGRAGDPCLLSVRISQGLTYITVATGGSAPLTYCNLDQGLLCDPSTVQCVQLAALGATCTGFDCEPGLYCDGTCKTGKPEGSACVEFDECGSLGLCEEGQCHKITIADTDICEGDFGD